MKSIFKTKIFSVFLAFCFIHLAWWAISVLWQNPILPNPISVYQIFPKLVQENLIYHVGYSLFRVFSGLSIAILIGSTLGYLMGLSHRWNQILDPILYLLYPIPKLALLPIIMLMMGLGEAVKITLIVLIVMPQIVLATRDAVKDIPIEHYLVFDGINASAYQKFIYITFPASLYAIISVIRLMLGTTLSILFFAENYGTKYGMGYLIVDAWMRMDYKTMYAGILLLSIIGCTLFILIDIIEQKLIRWKK